MSIKKAKKENVCIEDILRALSDNEALVLFNTIALAEGTQIQIQKIGLTRRQYYAKLSKLTESDFENPSPAQVKNILESLKKIQKGRTF